MGELIGLVAVILIFGTPLYVLKRRYDLREKRLLGEDRKLLQAAEEERQQLVERIAQLEEIVYATDFELNRKLSALEVSGASQKQLGEGARAAPRETGKTDGSD